MNTLIERLEELSEEAHYQSLGYEGFSDLSEYYSGYSNGIATFRFN